MQPNFEIVTTISDKLFPLPVVTDWGFHSLVDSVCTEQERLSPSPGIVARANRMNRYYITECDHVKWKPMKTASCDYNTI
jgi:hypothetical protein